MIDASFAQGLVGITLDGRYRLDAVLGEGGMGAVFRATQLAMERKVAVKLLKPHLTGDQAALERFAREARATLKVESPHAVKLLDFGVTPRGDYYMVLEYLDGRTVQRELEIDGPFAPARVAHIARQALHALGAAHAQGLIHRDVKPDNLLLMRAGADGDYTKVLDFGVAKLMQGAAGDAALLAQTAAGVVFGTPQFMSPEQALGQPLDGRSDLYSLAATMFLMLTGAPLFEGTTTIEWLAHHAQTPAPRLAMVRPELAAYPELDKLLQRCLAKHRDERPGTAGEMARRIAELEPALAHHPPRPAAGQRTPSHASSYVPVLRGIGAASTAAIAVLAPPGSGAPAPRTGGPGPGAAAAPDPGSTTAAPDPVAGARPARRGIPRWVGGIAIASLIGAAVGLSIHRSGPRSGPRPRVQAGFQADFRSAPPSGPGPRPPAASIAGPPPAGPAPHDPAGNINASSAVVPATAAAAPEVLAPAASSDLPAVPPPSPPGPRPARPPPHLVAPARKIAAEEHLRNAEDAFQNNRPLRQLAEADLALRADPRSARARYLLGDALIRSGDIDRGCSYLAAIRHLAAARDRARAAGCPGD